MDLKASNDFEHKQEPCDDIPEHGPPRLISDVRHAPPHATVNSADTWRGALLLSISCILRARAPPPRGGRPINMPVAPELASSPKTSARRKPISPTPPQLSLPGSDRPPSRRGETDPKRPSFPQSYVPHIAVLNAIRIHRPAPVHASVPSARNQSPPTRYHAPTAHESKPPPRRPRRFMDFARLPRDFAHLHRAYLIIRDRPILAHRIVISKNRYLL